ncbi:cytochrome P450 oxidoreductase [Cladophialophora psammophila CBS 110553]|uniref:Cytochrome P450 oxidoreductase n=1 Tax=Cladophialophora psammophila CBS 110553 TaxID=1182543 RepID=W9XKJ3_9EURO|nr:cytochrome P450 oxidoreductase [Cladophialophora psammophila CBS 110553]EXJ70874.1 cytochrome P450 oxidoreductase [Cladophialophora psammophila CBS 110553]
MLGVAGALFTLVFAISYFILVPFITYLRDQKGLRKYPNLSLWSGISDLPFIYEAHRGFRSHALLEAHRKSPVVRIGPNSLSFSSPEAIKDIYGHNTKCSKDVFYQELAGSHFHLADVVDKPEHARKRKMLSSAYAIKNLEGWEHKVADMTARLIRAFDARCSAPRPKGQLPTKEDLTVDYRMWTNLFTVAAIANIGLSEDLGFLDRGDDLITSEAADGTLKKVHFRECLHATAWAQSNLVWSYSWYKRLVRLSKIFSRTYREKWRFNQDWDGIVRNRATTRFKRYLAGEQLDDFFTAILHDKSGRPNNLEWGEMVAEVSIMMNAGSDTTAIAMNNAMFLLLKNPACLERLREELDNALGDDEGVASYDRIKHLPYLRACLDESLRLFPPTTFGLPRRTPAEGAPVAGDFIAGDTSVSMSSYVVHRDKTIFPDPEEYKPERWLGPAGKELQPYFIAFSAGARGCIGRNISYLEQMVLLASVIHRFEFALPHPEWEPTRRENFNLSPGPMPLKVWRRERMHE